MAQKHELKIAFLICDEPAEKTLQKHGGFHDMMHNLLEPLLKEEHDLKLVVNGYDVVQKREYPSPEELKTVDAICISGSFVDDAGTDTAWIARLCGFVGGQFVYSGGETETCQCQVVYLHDEYPRIRQIGICFGHQVIARAFGAKVGPNDKGWEIGSTELTLTEEGKKLLGTPGNPEDKLHIQQVHSDHVQNVPEGFELLASSEKCKVQCLAKYYGDENLKEGNPPGFTHETKLPPAPYSNVHILTTQGHPEWGNEVIDPLVDEFLKEGKIDKELARTAKEYTKKSDDAEKFGKAVLRVLGVARDRTHKLAEEHKS